MLKDYRKLMNHKLGKKKLESEDINEILLSPKYYPNYGEYGLDNFLMFYADDVKRLLLAKELDKGLEINVNQPRRLKI